MKKFTFFSILLLSVFFTLCKRDRSNNDSKPSLMEAQTVLSQTHDKFYELAAQTKGDPRKAIMLTKDWVLTQENVADAEVFDSTYLRIVLKSGILTTYSFNEVDNNGHSLYRGSRAGSAGVLKNLVSHGCRNNIENKKVLIYAAAYSEFYAPGEIQSLLNMFTAAGSDFEVTLLKDEQCTVGMIKNFGDYGLVIIDTHGMPDGFKIGTTIHFTTPVTTEQELKDAIIKQAGQEIYDMIVSGDIGYASSRGVNTNLSNWYYNQPDIEKMDLYVTTKYLDACAKWPGTVILGNMCYSANNRFYNPKYFTSPPIRTAFLNRELISYYGYSKDNDYGEPVTDSLSKQMEDSLIRSFLVDGDTTGIAHLRSDNTEYSDYIHNGLQKFKHFLNNSYCYGKCGDDLVDARDGRTYQTTCIGNQVWMAENLRYEAPGSICYAQSVGNCVTYGRLYNWNTVMKGASGSNTNPSGKQGICPQGWHIPSVAEWYQLINFVGGIYVAGGILKETSGWNSPNTGATDAVSFSALPGGYCDTLGVFKNLGTYGHWWTSRDSASMNKKWFAVMSSTNATAGASIINGGNAMSCRCVKDK